MRKTLTATAFVLAATLLTGCGSSDGGTDDKAAGKESPAATEQSKKPQGSGERVTGEGTPHEVTVEVQGTGDSTVMWTLDESGFEKTTLPWKKTATIAARGAEQKVGRLVIVTPGTMRNAEGQFVAAKCKITVDGKVVAESADDKGTPCKYMLK
jgi:predicted small secreted protein